MSVEVKVPEIGESISEVTIGSWMVEDGDFVEEGDILCEIESDKASVELPADGSGVVSIKAEAGSEQKIGDVIAVITPSDGAKPKKEAQKEPQRSEESDKNDETSESSRAQATSSSDAKSEVASPAAKKILSEKGLSASDVKGSGKDGRITKEDAMSASASSQAAAKSTEAAAEKKGETAKSSSASHAFSREQNREKMTRLRKTIAKRLVEAKNTTAMLTTFNEVDMSAVMEIRKKYKEKFKEKHDINLGFMSFFTKACTHALKEVPAVNALIDGEEIVYHDYADVGVAVSTPKGLVVPVIRNAESLGLADIEREIVRLALKARDGKLSLDEMQGGTFTITNGGIFGSMLSTPIINLPQSAILGMHNIVERPVAIDGKVEIRPIMYVALSYDHRLIDGRESVTFLYKVKELLEDPTRLLLEV